MRIKFVQSKTNDEFPDLTDGKVYEAEEDTIDLNGETRYFVYDDCGDEDPTPYPINIFDIER
jgi:hypothetical protein